MALEVFADAIKNYIEVAGVSQHVIQRVGKSDELIPLFSFLYFIFLPSLQHRRQVPLHLQLRHGPDVRLPRHYRRAQRDAHKVAGVRHVPAAVLPLLQCQALRGDALLGSSATQEAPCLLLCGFVAHDAGREHVLGLACDRALSHCRQRRTQWRAAACTPLLMQNLLLQAFISTGGHTGLSCEDGANVAAPTCGWFKDASGAHIQCAANFQSACAHST